MAIIYGVAAAALLCLPRGSDGGASMKTGTQASSSRERWTMLDITRIFCIACVVAEHSGGHAFAEHNAFLTDMFALQFLFVTSGVAFMMSRRSFTSYFIRYAIIFVTGVVCNVIGDVVARPGWYTDIGNTIFHMSYVVAIVIVSFCAWPLRSMLRQQDDSGAFGLRILCVCIYGTLWVGGFVSHAAGAGTMLERATAGAANSWLSYVGPLLANLPHEIAHVSGFGLLVSLHRLMRKRSNGLLPWLLLAYVYVPVWLFPMPMAFGPHMVMLYLMGVIVQVEPLAGANTIAAKWQAYWGILTLPMVLMVMVSLHGRCSVYPALTLWERFRWYSLECILQILLLTKAFKASDPDRILPSLGWWALFAYCSHWALATMLPTPYGSVIVYALGPVFPLVALAMRRLERRDGKLTRTADSADGNAEVKHMAPEVSIVVSTAPSLANR